MNSENRENITSSNTSNTLNTLKANEIFAFNLWLLLSSLYIVYVIVTFMPKELLLSYFNIVDLQSQSVPVSVFFSAFDLVDRYWLVAVPIHFTVTVICIFCLVKGWNYYIKEDDDQDEHEKNNTNKKEENKIKNGYGVLSEDEMIKEILYDRTEGIVPNIGDLDEAICKEILEGKIKEKKD